MTQPGAGTPTPTSHRAARGPGGLLARLSGPVKLLLLAGVVVVVGAVWIVVTGWRARADLEALRHDVSRLRADLVAGRVAAVHQELAKAQADAAAAHARTTGPAWWVGAHVPGLSDPLGTVRAIAATGHSLSRSALPDVVAGGVALDPQQLRIGPDRIDLDRLTQAAPPLRRALPAVSAARARVEGLAGSWLGPVSSGRRSLLEQLTSLEGTLRDTVTATQLMPDMLGGDGPRTYLVVFEGDNEVRGLGGIFGGYGLLTARDGRLQFGSFGSDREFRGITAQVNLGRRFEAAYGGTDPYRAVQDADVSPHFPYAARIWSSMAAQHLGVQIDGVVAMDPVMLARVLDVIGSVRTPDGTVLTGKNLVRMLDVGVYQRFDSGTVADTPQRKAFFVAAAKAVTQAALHRKINATRLMHALGRSAGEHRLVAFSSRPGEEARLAATPLGGVLAKTDRPFAQVSLVNNSGTKLGYFLHSSVVYQRPTCAATTSSVTFTLRNTAPTSGLLPEYMTRGVQWGDAPHPPGSEMLIVSLYSTQGSSLANVTYNGQPWGRYTVEVRGHLVTETSVTIKPGETVRMVFTVNEPAATGPVVLPVQPLAQPMAVRAEGPTC